MAFRAILSSVSGVNNLSGAPIQQHTTLCEGSTERAAEFISSFDASFLQFHASLSVSRNFTIYKSVDSLTNKVQLLQAFSMQRPTQTRFYFDCSNFCAAPYTALRRASN